MGRYFGRHHLIVYGGAIVGLIAGVVVWDTDPQFFGWMFGLGLGLLGGSFVAAVTSGTALANSPKRTRRDREWLLRGDEDDRPPQ